MYALAQLLYDGRSYAHWTGTEPFQFLSLFSPQVFSSFFFPSFAFLHSPVDLIGSAVRVSVQKEMCWQSYSAISGMFTFLWLQNVSFVSVCVTAVLQLVQSYPAKANSRLYQLSPALKYKIKPLSYAVLHFKGIQIDRLEKWTLSFFILFPFSFFLFIHFLKMYRPKGQQLPLRAQWRPTNYKNVSSICYSFQVVFAILLRPGEWGKRKRREL